MPQSPWDKLSLLFVRGVPGFVVGWQNTDVCLTLGSDTPGSVLLVCTMLVASPLLCCCKDAWQMPGSLPCCQKHLV